MEAKVQKAFAGIDDENSLTVITRSTKEVQTQLIEDHFGDRFLQAANACRFWPKGRGIYHSREKSFLVWVGEEDHLRIIAMEKGGNVGSPSVPPTPAPPFARPFTSDSRKSPPHPTSSDLPRTRSADPWHPRRALGTGWLRL